MVVTAHRDGIVLKVSSKKKEGFFVVFFREDLPEKTPPAELPTSTLWADQ
jgi:hypothetical protein